MATSFIGFRVLVHGEGDGAKRIGIINIKISKITSIN
jgi:hypothetical protein